MEFEWTSRVAGAIRNESDGKESEERFLRGTDLAANADFCDLRLVAFLLNGFLGYGAECLFVRIFRRFARTPNHFFSRHDPHEPVGFRLIPGNFHSVGTHSFLHARCNGFYSLKRLGGYVSRGQVTTRLESGGKQPQKRQSGDWRSREGVRRRSARRRGAALCGRGPSGSRPVDGQSL